MSLSRFSTGHIAATLTFSVLLLAGCGGGGGSSEPSTSSTISVDFSQNVPTAKSMVGFLHSMGTSQPLDSMITPLQPKLWRAGILTPQIYPRALSFHSDFVLVCSDFWGYDPGKRPDLNFPAYTSEVTQLAQQHQREHLVYDIWNEPDGTIFWSGNLDQFLQTFKAAHDAIRSVQPDALIGGPSFYHYNHEALQLFLNYCLSHSITLNVLSWHEDVEGDQIADIQGHVEEARRDFVNNPKYAPLGIQQIQINEYSGPDIVVKPASTLGILGQLERGGADSAARSCWDDPAGGSDCGENTLDGLLTPDGQPRAVWWAYKAYADGVGSRVLSTSTNNRFVSLASSAVGGADGSQSAPQVIVGMYHVQGTITPTGSATVNFSHLSAVPTLRGATTLRLSTVAIPASDGAPLMSLPPPTTQDVPIVQDTATVNLPVTVEQAYVITLTHP